MAEIRYNENGSITLSVNGKEETFEQVNKLVNFLRDNNLEISVNEIKTIDRQLFKDFDLRGYLDSINKTPAVIAAETNITLSSIEKILNKEDVNMPQFRDVIQYLNCEMFLVKDGEEIKFTSHHKWGDFLTKTRRKAGLSHRDIAKQVGCTSPVVGSLEMKRLPRLQTFCKILDTIGIKLYIQSK
ncbi:MAG: helix-turn-helix transcriptional regulator [Bacteroidales bacterium]|nr:helix-turn-helix transcriptional regulator [Bacteroidales bacterium]